ncbi:MAG: DNA repair protein RadC [Tissierellales bacterium]|nr:DNA repair protein RadC [Tissierellales bacterium]MBN2827852.1 DNA repair protein RadC [Tissierellales bacterium]
MDHSEYTIKSIPKDERPREKLIKYGASTLSNSELLAIILRVGSNKDTAITLSQKILNFEEKGLRNIASTSPESLLSFHGISDAKAAQIMAAVEIGRRVSRIEKEERFKITSPQDISSYVMDEMRYLKKEYFKIILLDTKNKVIEVVTISIGSLNSSIVHPREVFLEAIRKSAASIILVHNHPSGDTQPSREDISITKRLIEAGDILGVKVLDHLIIGDGVYYSFKEEKII